MDYKNVIKDIQSKKISPIYLFHGDEPYYIDLLTSVAEKEILMDSEKAFNQTVLYGKDANARRIIDEAMQFPMMSTRRLIIIKEAQDLKSIGDLSVYFEKPNSQSTVVLSCKKKFDKRLKVYKLIDKQGVICESKKIYDNQLPQWIQNYCRDNGYNIETSAAEMSAEYLGNQLSKVSNEFDKLFVSHDKEKTITTTVVQELIGISKEYNVFELQKALGQGNFLQATKIIKYMGNNPKSNPLPMVVSSLYNYFTKVFIIAANTRGSDQELQRSIGLSSAYFLKDYKIAARNFPYAKMPLVMNAISSMDLQSKGVGHRSLKEKDILREFIVKIFMN